MRYEEVLQQAIDLLNEGINEGKIIKGAVEDTDEHEGNCEQITEIAEWTAGRPNDEEILALAADMPRLLTKEPDFDCGSTSPIAIMRENLYEILLDDVWDKFEEEGKDANI